MIERQVRHVGKFSEQQKQVCHLLNIGLTVKHKIAFAEWGICHEKKHKMDDKSIF